MTDESPMILAIALLIGMGIGYITCDTVMINDRARYQGTANVAERFLRGSGNQMHDLPGCTQTGCVADLSEELEMFVSDGWGTTLTIKSGEGLTSDIKIFISDLQFEMPISYMYTAVRGSMFSMWGINYQTDGDLYAACTPCSDQADLSYGVDVHGNDMTSVFENKFARYSDYKYCEGRRIYKYPWYNIGFPGAGECTNQPAYMEIHMCIQNRMAYYFDDVILAYEVNNDPSFTAKLNVEINGQIRTAEIDSTMNNGYDIVISDDISVKVEGWGTLPSPDMNKYVLVRCQIELDDKDDPQLCKSPVFMVSNAINEKGIIPRSGFGEYQIVRAGSDQLLYDKTKLIGFPEVRSGVQKSNKVDLGIDMDSVENLKMLNDEIINKNSRGNMTNMYKTVHTIGLPDLSNTSSPTRNNKYCPFTFTSPSLNYISVLSSNFKTAADEYSRFSPIEPNDIVYEDNIPVLRSVAFRSLMSIKTDAKIRASAVSMQFTNDEGTIESLTEVKSIIVTNAAGSYTKFSFDYLGSGGNVDITSENLQLGTQTYYCPKPAEYTLIVAIRSNDGSGNYQLCVNKKCIKLSPDYVKPGDGGTDEPGVITGGGGSHKGYFTSFMDYMFSGIISTLCSVLIIIVDLVVGGIVLFATAKSISRLIMWIVWILVLMCTCGRKDISAEAAIYIHPVEPDHNSGFNYPYIQIDGYSYPAFGSFMKLSEWENRYGDIKDNIYTDQCLGMVTRTYGFFEFGAGSRLSVSTPVIKSYESIVKNVGYSTIKYPNVDYENGGSAAVLLHGREDYLSSVYSAGHEGISPLGLLVTTGKDNCHTIIDEYRTTDEATFPGSTFIKDENITNIKLYEDTYKGFTHLAEEGAFDKEECYIFYGSYLIPNSVKEGNLYIRCVRKNAGFIAVTVAFMMKAKDPSIVTNGLFFGGNIRTTALSEVNNAITINIVVDETLLFLLDADGNIEELLDSYYRVVGSSRKTMSCTDPDDEETQFLSCQLLIECYDQCEVTERDPENPKRDAVKRKNRVHFNSTLSNEGMEKLSNIKMRRMKKVMEGYEAGKSKREFFLNNRGTHNYISEFHSSGKNTMKFTHDGESFTFNMPKISTVRSATVMDSYMLRIASFKNIGHVVSFGEELIKRRKYNMFNTMFDTDNDIIYARGNVYEAITGGPILVDCIKSKDATVCNKDGMIAKLNTFEGKEKGEKSSIERNGIRPRNLLGGKMEANMVRNVGLLPHDRDCTGYLIWNENGQIVANEDCAILTDDNWESFRIITPEEPYKIKMQEFVEYGEEPPVKEIRSWPGTYDSEFVGRMTTRSGCERCGFNCMMECARNVWPTAYYCWWLSPFIITGAGAIIAIISMLCGIRLNTNFKRYAVKAKGTVTDVATNISNGDMKFWRKGKGHEDYLQRYNKYDKRDKEPGYKASKNSVANTYKDNLANDANKTRDRVSYYNELAKNKWGRRRRMSGERIIIKED